MIDPTAYRKALIKITCYIVYTGCPDQIGRNLKITLLHNQKTCRKCKDSFGIVGNRAIKYVLV